MLPYQNRKNWNLTRSQLNQMTDHQWWEFLFTKGIILDILIHRLEHPDSPQFTWTSKDQTVNDRINDKIR